jgi:hypothetical protein
MGFAFNPFTGNFDLKGSGGGGGSAFFAGEVAAYADLPLDGTAALNSRWLVRNSSGTWPFPNYRQGGIYIRTSIVGSSRDNDYTLADTKLPDVFADSAFLLYDNSDSTRNLQFDLGSITTGTTRTLTAPNSSGRIQIEGQPIGNTTPAAGTFTTLTANNGTLTGASAPVLDLAQTWNNAAVTFTGIRFNATNTASAAASRILDLQVDGTTQFAVRRGTSSTAAYAAPSQIEWYLGTQATPITFDGTGTPAPSIIAPQLIANTDLNITAGRFGSGNLFLRSQSNLVEIRGVTATSAQELRINNTFTSATNHERGFLRWSSNVFQIGTEKGSGGGTARALEFQTDGVTRMGITTGGNITIGTGTTNGFYQRTTNAVTFLSQNVEVNGAGLQVANSIEFGSGLGGLIDTTLARDAANILAMRRSTNAQAFRIYNTASGTNNVNFDRVNFRWASNEFILDAEAGGTGTLRGIKIGSATSSLLGFYGATPVDRPATVADPAGGGTIDTEARTAINDIIDRLQELGLIA